MVEHIHFNLKAMEANCQSTSGVLRRVKIMSFLSMTATIGALGLILWSSTSDEHKYSNIRIKWPQILFVFVFLPFPKRKYIWIFIRRFLYN